MSAISFWHKIHNWSNPVDTFVIRKCLIGISQRHPPVDPIRIPVTPALLISIFRVLRWVLSDPFDIIMYKAVFSLAFFAFLRVSEYAQSHHSLQLSDVSILHSAILLHFRSFKFSSQQVAKIPLPAIDSELCPVNALRGYLSVRPGTVGQLFVSSSGEPLNYNQVCSTLRLISTFLNIPSNALSSHSFRIGAATTATASSIPDEVIMRMGRWSSTAFRKYIRCQVNCFR